MTEVNHYVPMIKSYHFCQKGQSHSQQPLNIVCLDPLCRQIPLGCSVCFSEIHKYHKTISLDEFLNDYAVNIKKTSNSVKNRVKKQKQILHEKIRLFKYQIQQKLQNFELYFQQYFCFLNNQSKIRKNLGLELGINLEPKVICESDLSNLEKSIQFIISNSLFKQNRIINVSSILKQNQNKILALLDKITNQTKRCHLLIQNSLEKLSFVKQTLNHQSLNFKEMIQQFNNKNTTFLSEDPIQFACKQTLNQTLNFSHQKQSINVVSQHKCHKNCHLNFEATQIYSNKSKETYPSFNFGIYKNQNLLVDEKNQCLKSNISALKPQYALLTPNLNIQPQTQQNWSLKINSCRNFASKNTLAIGVGSLSELKKCNFQSPNCDNNILLVTSQGYIIKNGRCEKSKFIYGQGDTLHLKYDPFYQLLIISKDNGRKITLKTTGIKDLHGCVRMTYASDQVQIV